MAEDKPDLEPLEENVPTPIDPHEAAEAVKEVKEAMAILPKKRFGCLARFAKYGAVLLVLLAVFVYWNFASDSAAEDLERDDLHHRTAHQRRHAGRLLRRVGAGALSARDEDRRQWLPADCSRARRCPGRLRGNRNKGDTEARSAQVYEKLGLDPAIEPTMTYIETSRLLAGILCNAKASMRNRPMNWMTRFTSRGRSMTCR